MEDELMFSMEEEGSSSRSSDKRCAPKQRVSSLTDDDDGEEDEAFMCSILEDDPVRNICQYMQNLVNNRQLSNSLPKTEFLYKVRRRRPRRMFSMVLNRTFFVNRNNIFLGALPKHYSLSCCIMCYADEKWCIFFSPSPPTPQHRIRQSIWRKVRTTFRLKMHGYVILFQLLFCTVPLLLIFFPTFLLSFVMPFCPPPPPTFNCYPCSNVSISCSIHLHDLCFGTFQGRFIRYTRTRKESSSEFRTRR